MGIHVESGLKVSKRVLVLQAQKQGRFSKRGIGSWKRALMKWEVKLLEHN